MGAWRTIFFGINFAACTGWILLAAVWVVEGSEGTLDLLNIVAGILLASPAIVVAVAEWLLFARRRFGLERPLGFVAGLLGLLALFAFVANASEAIMSNKAPGVSFWLGFGGVCVGIAAYGFWCSWLRVRHKTGCEPRGFRSMARRGGELD